MTFNEKKIPSIFGEKRDQLGIVTFFGGEELIEKHTHRVLPEPEWKKKLREEEGIKNGQK